MKMIKAIAGAWATEKVGAHERTLQCSLASQKQRSETHPLNCNKCNRIDTSQSSNLVLGINKFIFFGKD